MVSCGTISLSVDARILSEYEEVLARPRFSFDPGSVAALLDYINVCGEMVASGPLTVRLPDPDDEPFLEVAVAGMVDCLVTGNRIHFPEEALAGVRVLAPAEFVEWYRSTAYEEDV